MKTQCPVCGSYRIKKVPVLFDPCGSEDHYKHCEECEFEWFVNSDVEEDMEIK